MNEKEIGELRRRTRRDRSNITAIFGCYVNEQGEIIAHFRSSTGIMSENEADRYFSLLRRTLSGTLGKNLTDISFRTEQVAGSPEHKLLMDLREEQLENEQTRLEFYEKIIGAAPLEGSYLILLACDNYDVPFRGSDGRADRERDRESFRYIQCAVCPVKQAKPRLSYVAEEKCFHDGSLTYVVSSPELGFLFPAFDDRATNLYGALYYTHSTADSREPFVHAIFNTPAPMPAQEQKKTFDGLLSDALGEQCSLDVVQTVHDHLCQRMEEHKQSKDPEPLLVTRDEVEDALADSGVAEEQLAKFRVDFDETFGTDAQLPPKNLVDDKHFQVVTPEVSIQVDPARRDLIETRVLGGTRYILICADGAVEVNGVNIHIREGEAAPV